MFSIANLLDSAKAKANIESDYRLAKVIRVNQSAISNYRCGVSLPNVEVIESLCALSGDDAGLVVAQVEAARAKSGPVRLMWESVAKRLAGGVTPAILSVLFAIGLIAAPVDSAGASGLDGQQTPKVNMLYIVSITFLSVRGFLLVRLRWFPAFFGLCRLPIW